MIFVKEKQGTALHRHYNLYKYIKDTNREKTHWKNNKNTQANEHLWSAGGTTARRLKRNI